MGIAAKNRRGSAGRDINNELPDDGDILVINSEQSLASRPILRNSPVNEALGDSASSESDNHAGSTQDLCDF